MKVRKLTKEDRIEAGLISTVSFHTRAEDEETAGKDWGNDTVEDWGAFSEEGVMMARIINNRYSSYINGRLVENGGIGAVSTLPEYRNSGAIREIFNALLKSAYENGEVISTLYPFNHSFYRKFGYETVCYTNNYSFKPEVLKNYKFNGEAKLWKEGDSVEAHTEIYNEFAKAYNLMAARSVEYMKGEHIKGKYYKDRVFTYLLSENGKAVSYITFKDVQHDPMAILEVTDIAWISREGFYAILGFLSRFSADYGTIELSLPTNINLYSIIKALNNYEISNKQFFNYMIRVVNAKKALEAMDWKGQSFVIKIVDDLISENSRTYLVGSNIEETDQSADMETDIRAFSQLVSGVISLDEAMLRDDVRVAAHEDVLRMAFTKKPVFVEEHF